MSRRAKEIAEILAANAQDAAEALMQNGYGYSAADLLEVDGARTKQIREFGKHLDHWESEGHSTVQISTIRRHLGIPKGGKP
jgi:hypothetical protein